MRSWGSQGAGERLFTPAFVLLSLADLGYFVAVGIAIHTLPLFVTGPLASDEGGAGLAFGAFAVTALICRPFAGRLTDTLGRRPLLLVGAAIALVGFLAFPYAHSLTWVIALRLLQGVGEAFFFVAGFAMLADLAPPSRMGEAVSFNSLGLYLGIAFGPPIGEALLHHFGFTVAWRGAAACALAAMLLVVLLPETREPGGRGGVTGRAAYLHLPAIPPSLGFFAMLASVGGFLAFATLHGREIGVSSTSTALALYGAIVVVCRVAFAKVPDRVPSLPLATGSLLLAGGGLMTMAVWQAPGGMYAGVCVMAVGVAFSMPAFFAAIFATATPGQRGAASGTATAFMDLGLGFGPVLLGLVARSQGIPVALGVAAAVALVGAVWTIGLSRRGQVRTRG